MHAHVPLQCRISSLWEGFLKKIYLNAFFLDSLLAVFLHNADWKRDLHVLEANELHENIIELLRSTAPGIVVLKIAAGVDARHPIVKGSIVIPESWAGRWDRVMRFEPDSRLALVLEALLKSIITHQLAHWLADFDHPHFPLKDCRLLSMVESAKLTKPELKGRGKTVDPGDYVEMGAVGGIAGFDNRRDDIFFKAKGHNLCFWSPSTEFLLSTRKMGCKYFRPGSADIRLPDT